MSVVLDDNLLKNCLLYEIYAYCQKHQLKVTVCVDTFNALLPERFSRGENLDRSLRTKAKTLYDDMRKVRKKTARVVAKEMSSWQMSLISHMNILEC